ncbi:DNA replication endonuclease-helicase Dna2, variant 2 [Entomophthora muscae]|uniref:DNA replication endonuclease-helicase Dna2, variant 2 n=3 Tax=Entomophthora muscae TaxID=34485 RepID=A0ACC2TKF7_9FUNG|nr:DNA replication endonuclease-helicase Dna2, variant 2 [Entomophthora muscae]
MGKKSTAKASDPTVKSRAGKGRRRSSPEKLEVKAKESDSGADSRRVKKKICVNQSKNILNPRTPAKPPQVVIAKPRIARKVPEKLTLGAISEPEIKDDPPTAPKTCPEIKNEVSPVRVASPLIPDAAGEVYWGSIPVSKYLRTESNPSRLSGAAVDHNKHVENIISSVSSAAAKLPSCSSNKTESILELARQALNGRSQSIPKLPKAVSMERTEPRVNLACFSRKDFNMPFPTGACVPDRGSGSNEGSGVFPEHQQSVSNGKSPGQHRGLVRFLSVPAHVSSSMPMKANTNAPLDVTLSGSILEVSSLNSFETPFQLELSSEPQPKPTAQPSLPPTPNPINKVKSGDISSSQPQSSNILDSSLDHSAFEAIPPIGTLATPIEDCIDDSFDDLLCSLANQVQPATNPHSATELNLQKQIELSQPPPLVKLETTRTTVASQTEPCITNYAVNPSQSDLPRFNSSLKPNPLTNSTPQSTSTGLPPIKNGTHIDQPPCQTPNHTSLKVEFDFDDLLDDSFEELLKGSPPPCSLPPATGPILNSDDLDFSDSEIDYLLASTKSAPIPSFQAAAQFAVQQENTLAKGDFGPPAYHQCLVVEVQFQYYSAQDMAWKQDLQKPEKRLRLYDQQCGMERVAHLRDSWLDTKVLTGDCVNIIGEPAPGSTAVIIDDDAGYLILNPNILISSTHLAESFSCMRRATLSSRVRVQDSKDKRPLVFGNILHSILQQGLLYNRFDKEFLAQAAKQIIRTSAESLYMCDMDEAEAEDHIQEALVCLAEWAERYAGPAPRPGGTFYSGSHDSSGLVSVSRVLEVEENMCSPMFGLKGKIDVTVLTVSNNTTQTSLLEIKTGRAIQSTNHRAQTLLYLLMMSEKYQTPISTGWLLYLKGTSGGDMMTRVTGQRSELRAIMQSRNEMTTYLQSPDGHLPDMIKNPHVCKYCPELSPCAAYHGAVEGGTSETSGLGGLFGAKIDHLSPAHKEFFHHWERLLTLEEGKVHHLRQQIWCMLSDERSKVGDCLNEMVVIGEQEIPNPAPSNSLDLEDLVPPRWFTYKMAKVASQADPSLAEMSLAGRMAARHSQSRHPLSNHLPLITFGVGDPIVVSTDSNPGTVQHVSLAVGFVKELHQDHIVLNLDRKLKGLPMRCPNFHPTTFQAFEGERDLDFHPRTNINSPPPPQRQKPQLLYRIDKDEMTTGMLQVRNNLVELMVQPAGTVARLRALIVDLVPPSFRAISTQPTPSCLSQTEIDEEINTLNTDQQTALKTVLSAQDYTLILGMPGTGKTTTIARMIRLLVRLGKSVLIAAHTHSAVDTILCKLLTLDFTSFLRLGNVDKVHPLIRKYTPPPSPSVATLRTLYEMSPVVATTCLGVTHPIFLRRTFDYSIIDEASQVTLPICLGPLRFASQFVLVGDHYQLPPLVRNVKAKQGGLANSLFKRLSEAHLRAVVHLHHQYRMNQDIMDVANVLIYQEALRCGTQSIATSMLVLPTPENLHASHLHTGCSSHPSPRTCWIMKTIEPESRVIFFDTDAVPGLDEKLADVTSNPTEVALVSQIVQALALGGIAGDRIGIVSPYRSQLTLLSAAIQPSFPSVEVLTIDRAQGRDKDCIILSMVRSNPGCNVGDLLRDWRRINVAITRARHKLIIVGSVSTLSFGGGAVLSQLVALAQSRQWLYALPRDAPNLHKLPWPTPERSAKPTQ